MFALPLRYASPDLAPESAAMHPAALEGCPMEEINGDGGNLHGA
jgi:hypothetical protein